LKNEKSGDLTTTRMYRSTYSMEKESTGNEAMNPSHFVPAKFRLHTLTLSESLNQGNKMATH